MVDSATVIRDGRSRKQYTDWSCEIHRGKLRMQCWGIDPERWTEIVARLQERGCGSVSEYLCELVESDIRNSPAAKSARDMEKMRRACEKQNA